MDIAGASVPIIPGMLYIPGPGVSDLIVNKSSRPVDDIVVDGPPVSELIAMLYAPGPGTSFVGFAGSIRLRIINPFPLLNESLLRYEPGPGESLIPVEVHHDLPILTGGGFWMTRADRGVEDPGDDGGG